MTAKLSLSFLLVAAARSRPLRFDFESVDADPRSDSLMLGYVKLPDEARPKHGRLEAGRILLQQLGELLFSSVPRHGTAAILVAGARDDDITDILLWLQMCGHTKSDLQHPWWGVHGWMRYVSAVYHDSRLLRQSCMRNAAEYSVTTSLRGADYFYDLHSVAKPGKEREVMLGLFFSSKGSGWAWDSASNAFITQAVADQKGRPSTKGILALSMTHERGRMVTAVLANLGTTYAQKQEDVRLLEEHLAKVHDSGGRTAAFIIGDLNSRTCLSTVDLHDALGLEDVPDEWWKLNKDSILWRQRSLLPKLQHLQESREPKDVAVRRTVLDSMDCCALPAKQQWEPAAREFSFNTADCQRRWTYKQRCPPVDTEAPLLPQSEAELFRGCEAEIELANVDDDATSVTPTDGVDKWCKTKPLDPAEKFHCVQAGVLDRVGAWKQGAFGCVRSVSTAPWCSGDHAMVIAEVSLGSDQSPTTPCGCNIDVCPSDAL